MSSILEPEKQSLLKERSVSTALETSTRDEIKRHIKGLFSDDYNVRAESIAKLGTYGSEAAEVIVDSFIRKPDRPHAIANYSDALEEIGKPSLKAILNALGQMGELHRPEEVYLLESLVDLLGRLNDRQACAPLLEQIERLNRAIKRNHHQQLVHCCEAAKVRIHQILVDLGEKGGLEDLLEMLGDGRKRVPMAVVDAAARVGDRRALVPLLRLYAIEEQVSSAGANVIKEGVREIIRREHAALEEGILRGLADAERAVLERLMPKSRTANGKH